MRIIFDMDGTSAIWQNVPLDIVKKPGYFLSLEPDIKIIESAKMLIDMGFPVYICSKCYRDGHSENEKQIWLDTFLPEIKREHRIFVPYDMDKNEMIPGGVRPDDVLIDDYSENLHTWKGTGIKYLNGINGTKGTWKGLSVSCDMTSMDICAFIAQIASQKEPA